MDPFSWPRSDGSRSRVDFCEVFPTQRESKSAMAGCVFRKPPKRNEDGKSCKAAQRLSGSGRVVSSFKGTPFWVVLKGTKRKPYIHMGLRHGNVVNM